MIGCCGAFCGTCCPLAQGHCKGCKLGYDRGDRRIEDAKCAIKLCCVRDKGYQTCADCSDLSSCPTIQDFYRKNGYKYGKYREAIEFIKVHGYHEFLEKAKQWKGAYGRLL